MKIILADASQHRIELMDVTASVLTELIVSGVDVPALEIDDNSDNLFFSVRENGELYHNLYLQIRLDNDFYSDTPVYFVELLERQHSGGDMSLCDYFEFLPSDSEQYIDSIRAVYIEQLSKSGK